MPKKDLDVIAGDGSIAGIIRKQREALESGDVENMHPIAGENGNEVSEEPAPVKRVSSKNNPGHILRRGYLKP